MCTDHATNPNVSVGGWVGLSTLRKLVVRILVREIIRTPGNPIIIVRCTNFLGGECLDLGVGGSGEIRTLFGFVNLYKLLNDPLQCYYIMSKIWTRLHYNNVHGFSCIIILLFTSRKPENFR